ncbi:class II aldolase/adducin family protein [Orrella sp. NBD-18]|uniref:Class II aldolase/adducin family protein n=1 Tax=Sheuella amnicola TaxID=2707330 RepID=A0A6B2R1Q1_9BURK|nr:class II aldolase/adducin family protein [Sheuella amnicola]NDY83279.1 class II aldolase/adducin family protein [Sheuella amnicola]HBI82246.1 class II aldolase [Alcaligenaceae bacterium]
MEAKDGYLQIPSLKGKVSDAEWQARVNLAACYRLVDMYGLSDMIANHISARIPGEDGVFLINPYGMMYEEITASSLLKSDFQGNIVGGPDFGDLGYGVNRAGAVIHSAIHEARHDVGCVLHTHSWASMAVSSLECGILPLTQTAMRFLKVAYHDYQGVVLNDSEKVSLVNDLGMNNVLILRNHGALTTGSTIAEAFNWMHRLELSCYAQLASMACNSPLSKVPQKVLEETWNNYQPGTRRPFGVMEWPALLRKLDRTDPSYKN